jgi:SecD/SecF fusion protein
MRRSKCVIATYAMLLFLAVSAALPNFFPTQMRNSLPAWATGQTVTLGLDLQGGSHLLMAVNRDDLAAARLQDTGETVLAEMQALGLNPATLLFATGSIRSACQSR